MLAALKLPGLHSLDAEAPLAHADPAGHAKHAACAADGWYSPAAQPTHATPSDDTLPASHGVRSTAPLAHA